MENATETQIAKPSNPYFDLNGKLPPGHESELAHATTRDDEAGILPTPDMLQLLASVVSSAGEILIAEASKGSGDSGTSSPPAPFPIAGLDNALAALAHVGRMADKMRANTAGIPETV